MAHLQVRGLKENDFFSADRLAKRGDEERPRHENPGQPANERCDTQDPVVFEQGTRKNSKNQGRY